MKYRWDSKNRGLFGFLTLVYLGEAGMPNGMTSPERLLSVLNNGTWAITGQDGGACTMGLSPLLVIPS